MPEKDGDEAKSTKSVVNKKQKQMMGEEGYDIARDMGKVRPSKDKKDATTMPPSKEMEKTRKVVKGPSAFERVKAKYGKSVMNVGKKKANEELDLTQVAEALGGYIVEAPLTSLTGDPEEIASRIKKSAAKITRERQKKAEKNLAKDAGIKLTTQSPEQAAATQAAKDIGQDEMTPDVRRGLQSVAAGRGKSEPSKPRARRAKRAVYRDGLTKTQRVAQVKADIDQKELLKKAGASGDIGFTAPDRKSKVKKRTDRADAQGTPDPFSIDTSKASKEVAKDLGTKPVKGGLDFGTPGTGVKDFRFSPRDISTQQASDKVETGLKRAKKSFSQFSRDLQDYRDRDLPGGPRKTKRDRPDITGSGGRNRPRVTGDVGGTRDLSTMNPDELRRRGIGGDGTGSTEGGAGASGSTAGIPAGKLTPPKPVRKKGGALVTKGGALVPRGGELVKTVDAVPVKQSAIAKSAKAYAKFVKNNPVAGGVTSLAAYDLGKGILSKIMNLRGPGVVGGKAGFRSTGSFTAR